MNQKGISIGLLVVGIALAAVGLVFVNTANQAVNIQQHAEHWKKADGIVKKASVEDKNGKLKPLLVYLYTVDEKKFNNSRIFLSDGPYEEIEAIPDGIKISVYPPKGETLEVFELRQDQQIDVFYDPHAPERSVLIRYPLGEMKIFMLLGIIGLVLGLILTATSLGYESFE